MIIAFIWNINPDIISFGPFQIKWITILLLIGLLLARQALFFLSKREGDNISEAKLVFVITAIGAVIGARLFYVAFIDSEILFNKPGQILFPFEFNRGFRFIGENQFSMLGAMAGVILSSFIYAKRKGKSFLFFLDKGLLMLLIVLVFLRVGNFFQSDYFGKPTDSTLGVLAVNKIEHGLQKLPCCAMRNPGGENPLDTVSVKPGKDMLHKDIGYQPLIIYVFFKDGASEQLVNEFLIGDVKTYLFDLANLIYEPGTEPLHYTIFIEGAANYMARIQTIGISRHPLQLYEAAFFIVAIILLWYWNKNSTEATPGKIAGLILVAICGMHFMVEFLNNVTRPLLKNIPLTIDQYLCIPFLIAGVALLIPSFKKKNP